MKKLDFLLRDHAHGNLFTEPASLIVLFQYRSERLAAYTLFDFYGLEYFSEEASLTKYSGQDGPSHCSECAPYYTLPAKLVTVRGPSKWPAGVTVGLLDVPVTSPR